MDTYLTEEQFNAIMAAAEITNSLTTMSLELEQMNRALQHTQDAVKIKSIKEGIKQLENLRGTFQIAYEHEKQKVCGEPKLQS